MVLGYGFILVCKVILSSCMINYDNKVGYAIHHAFYLICGHIHIGEPDVIIWNIITQIISK